MKNKDDLNLKKLRKHKVSKADLLTDFDRSIPDEFFTLGKFIDWVKEYLAGESLDIK